jgi:hypothetical protein
MVEWRNTTEKTIMAKGQMKGNKEAKKPKSDKPKSGGCLHIIAGLGRPSHQYVTEKEMIGVDRHMNIDGRWPELRRKLGDDGLRSAAYRGGCRACQNLSRESDTP